MKIGAKVIYILADFRGMLLLNRSKNTLPSESPCSASCLTIRHPQGIVLDKIRERNILIKSKVKLSP
jgi:hypothetical protein